MNINDEADADCSDEFYLMAEDTAPDGSDAGGPYLTVTSPTEGDSAEAGEEYTVEVRRGLGVCLKTGLGRKGLVS